MHGFLCPGLGAANHFPGTETPRCSAEKPARTCSPDAPAADPQSSVVEVRLAQISQPRTGIKLAVPEALSEVKDTLYSRGRTASPAAGSPAKSAADGLAEPPTNEMGGPKDFIEEVGGPMDPTNEMGGPIIPTQSTGGETLPTNEIGGLLDTLGFPTVPDTRLDGPSGLWPSSYLPTQRMRRHASDILRRFHWESILVLLLFGTRFETICCRVKGTLSSS